MEPLKHKAWKGKSRGGFLGHFYFIITLKYLGLRAAYLHLLLVVPYFIPFAPKATRAIWYYNRKIIKYGWLKSVVMIFVHYYRFGQTIIDKLACSFGLTNRFKFEFDNYSQFLDKLNSGEGVVIIGAHVGAWEVGSSFFDDYGKKINIVMYDAEYQKIKNVIKDNSGGRNYKVIALNEDAFASLVKIKSALNDSEYVCFQGDRFMNDGNTFFAEFMGQKARFPKGPFLVASRMGVPVVFYFAMRESGRKYRFHFTMAQQPVRKPGVKPEEVLFEQYKDELEKVVRKYPQQWFNFYQFWK